MQHIRPVKTIGILLGGSTCSSFAFHDAPGFAFFSTATSVGDAGTGSFSLDIAICRLKTRIAVKGKLLYGQQRDASGSERGRRREATCACDGFVCSDSILIKQKHHRGQAARSMRNFRHSTRFRTFTVAPVGFVRSQLGRHRVLRHPAEVPQR